MNKNAKDTDAIRSIQRFGNTDALETTFRKEVDRPISYSSSSKVFKSLLKTTFEVKLKCSPLYVESKKEIPLHCSK